MTSESRSASSLRTALEQCEAQLKEATTRIQVAKDIFRNRAIHGDVTESVVSRVLDGTYQYYITFSERWRTKEHPTFKGAHPDGYAIVLARSMDEARQLADKHFGNAHSKPVFEAYWEYKYYPKGVIREVSYEDEEQ